MQLLEVIHDLNDPRVQEFFDCRVIVFDVETNTDDMHWKSSHDRGLSYVADMTEISMYCGGDWVLTMEAVPEHGPVQVEHFDRDGAKFFRDVVEIEATLYRFTDEQIAFMERVFCREDVTYVNHNLVFDARQVWGKLHIDPPQNARFHDTLATSFVHEYDLDDKPGATYDGDGEEDEEDDKPTWNTGVERNLAAVYDRLVGGRDRWHITFIDWMKGQRKNFPRLDWFGLLADVKVVKAIGQGIGKDQFGPYLELLREYIDLRETHNVMAFLSNAALEAAKSIAAGDNDKLKTYRKFLSTYKPLEQDDPHSAFTSEKYLNSEYAEHHNALTSIVIAALSAKPKKKSKGKKQANRDIRFEQTSLYLFGEEPTLRFDISKRQREDRLSQLLDIIPAAMEPLKRELFDLYGQFDVVAAYRIYMEQIKEKPGYPKYLKLLEIDNEYTGWCCLAAARGILVDRELLISRIAQLHDSYAGMLHEAGFGVESWDYPGKDIWKEDLIHWGGRFFIQYCKDHETNKTDSSYIKDAIETALASGQEPMFPYPDRPQAIRRIGLIKKKYRGEIEGFKTADGWYEREPTRSDISYSEDACDLLAEIADEMCMTDHANYIRLIGKMGSMKKQIDIRLTYLRESELDGRIHSTLGRMTDTGRNSSKSPNLQNLHFKKGDPLDMAGVLIADEGYWLHEGDIWNAENWSQAGNSGDNAWAMSCTASDMHAANASRFFPDEWSSADVGRRKELRFNAKRLGFGDAYGMGPKSMAYNLNVFTHDGKPDVDKAQAMMDSVAAAYPDLTAAKAAAKDYGVEHGYVIIATGRRARLKRIFNKRIKRVEPNGRAGWNYKNQGLIAEVIVRSIVRISRFFREVGAKSWICLQIHDSLIVQIHLDDYAIPGFLPRMLAIISETLDDAVDRHGNKFVDRTVPRTRFLVDLDNMTNRYKWGYREGVEYPFNEREYINQWGVHLMTDEEVKELGKAPTWVNEWGYGQAALDIELGAEEPPSTAIVPARPMTVIGPVFPRWVSVQTLARQAAELTSPRTFDGHVYGFPEAMVILQRLQAIGQTAEYNTICQQLLELHGVLDELKQHLTSN